MDKERKEGHNGDSPTVPALIGLARAKHNVETQIEGKGQELEREMFQLGEKHKKEQEELRAKQTIELIDPRQKLAALSGGREATIMWLNAGEWSKPTKGHGLERENLFRAALVVYDYCKKNDLSPRIDHGFNYSENPADVYTIVVPLRETNT